MCEGRRIKFNNAKMLIISQGGFRAIAGESEKTSPKHSQMLIPVMKIVHRYVLARIVRFLKHAAAE